jgi:hypothetical protein
MNMSRIGKFQMREIIDEFDATLIRLYGVNMLDAAINRLDALMAYDEFQCARRAAEACGLRRGLTVHCA